MKQEQENAPSNLTPGSLFYAFHSLNYYVLFILKDNFLFYLLLSLKLWLTFSFTIFDL